MIRSITLENYMSHAHTVIDLADGLTVLTGPNNCGKSAVVAALQILATNGRTTHVMRHGAKVCRVTVETDDGHVVTWERKKSVVKYTIDGEDVHRTGVSIPDSLHEKLRLDRVSAETGASKIEYDIHFGEQKSPVFLLNESGSRAASFFASSSDASRMVEMQHRHRTRVREQKQEANRLKAAAELVDARLKRFGNLDSVAESMANAEAMASQIAISAAGEKAIRESIDALGQHVGDARQLTRRLRILRRLETATTTPLELEKTQRRLEKIASIVGAKTSLIARRNQHTEQVRLLAGLTDPPPQHDVASVRTRIGQLAAVAAGKQITKARVAAMQGLHEAPATSDTRPLESLVTKLIVTSDSHVGVKRLDASLVTLDVVPPMEPVDQLSKTVSRLLRTRAEAEHCGSLVNSLATMKPPSEPTRFDAIAALQAKLAGLSNQVTAARKVANAAIANLDRCEAKVRSFVQANPKCGACGANIDPETVLSSVPSFHEHSPHEDDR